MTTRVCVVALTMAMEIIAFRVCALEYFIAATRIFRQRRNPHGSRVFQLSYSATAMAIRFVRANVFLRIGSRRCGSPILLHKRKFFSREGSEVARDDGFSIESARISAK